MMDIEDLKIYLKRMTKTFDDKAWFLKMIPKDVETIVDFGCADGSFLGFLQKKLGNKYRYIGIESNPVFRKMVKFQAFENLDTIWDHCDTSKTLLVLNSVLHEVAHYGDIEFFFNLISAAGFKYLAIRDMNVENVGKFNSKAEKELNNAIEKAGLISKKKDFIESFKGLYDGYNVVHFLMKYFYDENWDRECQENYLSIPYPKLHKMARYNEYDTIYEKFYLLEYFLKRWDDDFNLSQYPNLNDFLKHIKTHMKLFLIKGEEA